MQRTHKKLSRPLLLTILGALSLGAALAAYTYRQQDGPPRTPDDSAGTAAPRFRLDKGKLIDWYVKAGNSRAIRDSRGDIYLYLNVQSGEADSGEARIPLNVSLVLDRSGSMQGEKINYARRAAKFLVDQLSKDDYLSIVNYDDKVEVTSPSQPVKNKEALKHALDRIDDRGATNLSGGMLEGFTQVKTTKKEGFVNRVLLLTDGLANEGIVEPATLKRLVETKYKEEGIALSTFGLGADYNEDLLTMLAETGRANYYFIDSPDKIPQLFARELKGLLSVVAQNMAVQITLPDNLQCEKVYGYPYDVKNGQLEIRFNDINANDERAILVKLRPKTPLASGIDLNCALTYTNAQTFAQVKEEKKVNIALTDDVALFKKGEDAKVHEMLALFEATEDFDEVLSAVDAGNYQQAKDKGSEALYMLVGKQKTYNSPKLAEQITKMSTYVNSLDSVRRVTERERKMFQKSNKAMNYQVKKQKAVVQ